MQGRGVPFIVLAAVMLAAVGAATAAKDYSAVELKVSDVAPGIHVLAGPGANVTVLVGEDGVLLVDDELAPLAEKVRAAVARLTPAPIRLVVNTNWHFDHADGNETMARAGAVIVAHERSRQRMLAEQRIPEFDPDLRIPPYPRLALPVVTVEDSMAIHFGGENLELTHVPAAHSEGDLLVRIRNANVLHTGDLFFTRGLPFIHVSGGGTVDGMIRAADLIIGLCDDETRVIPGHGTVSNRQGVKEYRETLVAARDRIARLAATGKSFEEVLAAKPLDDLWARADRGVSAAMFTRLVWLDLEAQASSRSPARP